MSGKYLEGQSGSAQLGIAELESDPYRWLEETSEQVLQWQRAQARLAQEYVGKWPSFGRLQRLVEQYSDPRYAALPRYAAGRWFRARVLPGAAYPQAIVSSEPLGDGRVLLDPAEICAGRPGFVSWVAPSPDGRIVAIGVCVDGSENNTISLVDVESGRLMSGVPELTLMDNWTGGVQWLADSSGFFFSAISGSAADFEQQVYLHRLLPAASTQLQEVGWTERRSYRVVVVSRDGRYAVALERLRKPIPVAIATLDEPPLRWRPFITSVDGVVAGYVLGERYIGMTDVGSSRGRLVAIPLFDADPNDPANWDELVPESAATLRTVTPVGDVLYLTELVDTFARVRIVDMDGRVMGQVPLPGRGAIVSEMPFAMTNLLPKGHPEEFLFGFSSLTESTGLYRHIPLRTQAEVLLQPKTRLEGVAVADRFATSRDGTRIPYHVVRPQAQRPTGPLPTLIWAYGGFNLALLPQFPGPMAAFVRAGGVLVHAHLRGGGEFGADWWQSGRKRNKQNTFDDLYAVAEDVIESGVCAPETLAVVGTSLGGLLVGVAITQRPELWAAAVARVPGLDLIGHCRYPYGRMMYEELVDVSDPDDLRRLASISPYHSIRDGVRYPAVFLEAGDADARAPAWHARKFAARLQRASSSQAPVLLHVWEGVGHGHATDRCTATLQNAEWLAFVMRHMGMDDWD